jgi:CDGSH-type Zn-finger protein
MADSAASEQVPRITPTRNGPYEITGEVQIVAPDGTVIRETSKAYLCRCGHSGNKPFCDGSHRRQAWTEQVVSAT